MEIKTDIELGAHMWVLRNGYPAKGIVSRISCDITINTDPKRGFTAQIFKYFGKQNSNENIRHKVYVSYYVRLENGREYDLTLSGGQWYIGKNKAFATQVELRDWMFANIKSI